MRARRPRMRITRCSCMGDGISASPLRKRRGTWDDVLRKASSSSLPHRGNRRCFPQKTNSRSMPPTNSDARHTHTSSQSYRTTLTPPLSTTPSAFPAPCHGGSQHFYPSSASQRTSGLRIRSTSPSRSQSGLWWVRVCPAMTLVSTSRAWDEKWK